MSIGIQTHEFGLQPVGWVELAKPIENLRKLWVSLRSTHPTAYAGLMNKTQHYPVRVFVGIRTSTQAT